MIVIEGKEYKVFDRSSMAVVGVFDEVYGFRGELSPIRIGRKWGYIDQLGNIVIAPQYDDAGSFSEGLAGVRKDGKRFFINTSGEVVFHTDFSGGLFKEGLSVISVFTEDAYYLYGFIDRTGKVVIPPTLRGVGPQFDEGFARFYEKGFYGFINTKGEKAIPAKYDYVEPFSEGLAHVELNGKSGFINQKGEVVIPIKYDAAGTFECGVASAEIDGEWTFIDKTGKYMFPLRPIK